MQERVTSQNGEFAELVVQHNMGLMSVGVGLEPRSSVPESHFVDAIYGGVPNQTVIGRTLFERLVRDKAVFSDITLQFRDSGEEADFFNELGRMALDAVTGSQAGSNSGLWTWLDRAGTNRLIRLLRKARDSSFGRDE